MSTRVTRRIAAGATALALAAVGLVGLGASAASAIDTIPSDPTFGGTGYLYDGNGGAPIAPGQVIPWDGGSMAPLLIGTPTDVLATVGLDPTTIGATEVYTFMSPQGSEGNMQTWNALSPTGMTANGQLQTDMTPLDLLNQGLGTPSGQAAVKAAGGNYSMGIAYTKNNGVTVLKTFFIHITVAVGGNYTYQPVQTAAVRTATTTAITTSPSATVNTGDSFTLTATVNAPTATGTVDFKVGSATIGTATVAGGVGTTTTAKVTAAGANSVVAVYSGDSSFLGSTSPAVTVTAVLSPITTTTTVSATSPSTYALNPVTVSAHVAPVAGANAGTVALSASDGTTIVQLGTVPVNATGDASVTTSVLDHGSWTFSAAFTGVAPYVSSAGVSAASLTLTTYTPPADQRSEDQTVNVTIPAGTLSITTPWTTANPLNLGTALLNEATSTFYTLPKTFGSATNQAEAIQVIDRRAGALGFTAKVKSTPFTSATDTFPASHLGLINLLPQQVPGNTLIKADVHTTDIAANTPGLSGTDQPFAVFTPTGTNGATGTAWISGDVELKDIPTSVKPGDYTATLTFTVL